MSGPPEFIILSLLAALALYLRQVNLNAADVQYKIRHGLLWNALPEERHRTEKMEHLQWTSDTIMAVSPFLFALILVVCGRIVYDSFSRIYYAPKLAPPALYALDCFIVGCLTLNFAGLTIAHFVMRYKDDTLQDKIAAEIESDPGQTTGAN